MMQIVPQTKEEKIAMYMKLSKREIAEMLVNSNDALYKVLDNQQPQYVPLPQPPEPCNPWISPGVGDWPGAIGPWVTYSFAAI